jgi:hypothetical protein
MILQDKIETVERIGGFESKQFSVKVSRKAFQILSDLYSDKPLAILRELGCNARDSHVMSGKADRPIRIHLPNNLESFLEIRDFGLGLDDEEVSHIYSTYFESTKTQTNDAVGCLGLGSKSPFCYTDNFTVEAIKDGIKRTYLAYFDETGIPTITLGGTENTQEENGVAIKIPTRREDSEKFRMAAMKAFRFFEVRPEIVGGSIDWTTVDKEIAMSGNAWKMLKGEKYSQQSFALMGGVAYPISSQHIEAENSCVLHNLIAEFAIGELDFAPSRESLSYDPRTIKALNDRLAVIKTEIHQQTQDSIRDAKFIDEAFLVFNNIPEFARQALNNKFQFGGKQYSLQGLDVQHTQLTLKNWGKRSVRTYRSGVLGARWIELPMFKIAKKSDIGAIKKYMIDNNVSACSFMLEDDAKIAVDMGINPSKIVEAKTLPRNKATRVASTSGTRTYTDDRCGTFQSNGRAAFETASLKDKVADGSKYYLVRSKINREQVVWLKGQELSKEGIIRIFGNSSALEKVLVVSPTKEKNAQNAGLTSFVKYAENLLVSSYTNRDFLEYAKMKKIISDYGISFRQNDVEKQFNSLINEVKYQDLDVVKYLKSVADAKSYVSKHFDSMNVIHCLLSMQDSAKYQAIKHNLPQRPEALDTFIITKIASDWHYGSDGDIKKIVQPLRDLLELRLKLSQAPDSQD